MDVPKIDGRWTRTKIVYASVLWILMILWFAGAIAENVVVGFPRVADPSTGRTMSYHVKGTFVYLTPRENTTMWWLDGASWTAFAILLSVGVVTMLRRSRRRTSD
jgi:hypothetical protein